MPSNLVLTIVFLAVSLIYWPLNRRKSRYYWEIRLDKLVPLIPVFIVAYVAFFPYIAAAIVLLWHTPYETPLLITLITAELITFIFWYLFPNGTRRPEISPSSVFHKALQKLYRHDGDTNAFPSSHVFVTLICAYFLNLGYPHQNILIWSMAFLIIYSTLLTKQHYVLDVLGGSVMGILAVFLVNAI